METIAAVAPISFATRPSLELSASCAKILFISPNTNARHEQHSAERSETLGALTQTLPVVASISEKIRPNAPNAVTKLASTVVSTG